ncbi:MAG: lipoprotein-releasing ABC transporter permease subunit LolC [Pantoea sp. Brub]|nr:lipoprotein-releasing ABC transporter permease subunit LolC [Pantoea sp. Brub]
MYRPITLFIALRFLHGNKIDKFNYFISWLSAIGIMLGVLIMVIVLSIMNGFERELEYNMLDMVPHILITNKSNNSFNPKQFPFSIFKNVNNIKSIQPIITSDVIIQSLHNISIGTVIGIKQNERSLLVHKVNHSEIKLLKPEYYNVILGQRLALKLNVQEGDLIRLIIPSMSQLTPLGYVPTQRLFHVASIFFTNSEIDDYQILINQTDAANLMHYPVNHVTGWRLWLNNPLNIQTINKQSLPKDMQWHDWRQIKGELFQAIHIEKNMMSLLISLIIIVATFNLVSSLSLIIIDKQKEIVILQMQGMKRFHIISIFIIYGMIHSIIGTLVGAFFGVIISTKLNYLKLITDLLINEALLPVSINYNQIVIICISTIVLALLSIIYPAWKNTSLNPTEVLRYE